MKMEIRGAAGQEANIAEGQGWCDSDVLAGSLPLPCDSVQASKGWDAGLLPGTFHSSHR